MILFSACCICGLIGGILNFQFLRALTKKSSALYPLHLTSMSLACIGIGGCTLSSWLTCRLASYEQRRMFSEREHSLHHSHEMAEKVSSHVFFYLLCCFLKHFFLIYTGNHTRKLSDRFVSHWKMMHIYVISTILQSKKLRLVIPAFPVLSFQ